MERARKSSKKARQEVDRLGALPDGVICHILSFLPTKLSVETSVLAKRWRLLWAHVPVLAFDFDYANPKRASFPGIVNTVMLRHKVASLTTFRLTYYKGDDDDDGPSLGCYEHASCIATAVERNVQNLHLERLRVEVPRCLLTCETLVDLTMCRGVSIPPTAPVSLPNLKKLYLYHLLCKVYLTCLLSGCPVLEELSISGIKCGNMFGCCISSPTLKRLTIIHLLDRYIFIKTLALRYLKLRDRSSKNISISPCASLVEADMCMHSLCEPADVLKLLDSIRNVKSLNLLGYGKIWDGLMPGSIPKFGNLTKLEFSANWCFLSKFLESEDHLQVLVFREDNVHSENSMDPIEERCVSLLHSLRTVRIDGFRCKEQGFYMLRHILRNAQVLESIEINCPHEGVDLKEIFEAIRRISIFRRESKELNYVDFTGLLSSCPVLEELSIDRVTCSDPRGCYISSLTLKRLTIISLLDISMFNNPEYMVTINTPALRYLKVYDRSSKHISISLCAFLVEADIYIGSLCNFDDFYHHCLLKLLDSIRNVKCLKFAGYCDKVCDGRVPGSIAKFANSTKIEMYASWYLLPKFLESADHLQVLTISVGNIHLEHWRDPVEEERCACMLRSLRIFRIDGFRFREQGFNMVGYILRNAQVLERMEIHCFGAGSDLKVKFEAMRRIAIFRRESKECELHFS